MIRYVASLALGALLGGAAGAQPIVIGHVGNLSGPDGEQAARGIRLALHQLTEGGLRQAVGDRPVLVRHTDTHGQAETCEVQAARLVTVHRAIALIGGSTPAEVTALDRARVPVLSFLGFAPSGVSHLTFSLGMTPRRQGEVLGRYVAEELKPKHVTILTDRRREASAPFAEAFSRAFAAAHGAKGLNTLRGSKDQGLHGEELARRIEKETPDVLVFAGPARDLRDLRSELKRPLPVLVFAGDDGDYQALTAGPGSEPVYLATAFVPDAKSERVQDFVKRFRDAFKVDPDVHAALGYDAMSLLADALKRSYPELGSDALRGALAGARDFPGVTGPLTVTEGNLVRRPLYVARLAGSTWTPLRSYPPEP